MTAYEEIAHHELHQWKLRMQRKPSFTGRLAKKLQVKINGVIPEKVHIAITIQVCRF